MSDWWRYEGTLVNRTPRTSGPPSSPSMTDASAVTSPAGVSQRMVVTGVTAGYRPSSMRPVVSAITPWPHMVL